MPGAAAISSFRERFGEPADTPALVTLINVAFRPEQIAIEGDRIDAEKLQPFFSKGKFLALEDGEGLAGCVYAEVRGSRGYIGLLALRPELKGRGLGRRLMAQAAVQTSRLRRDRNDPHAAGNRAENPLPLH
jgi:GNAT superfamily N-acetyltransferase